MAQVDYYFSLNSPWSYLGHDRFLKIAAATRADVRPYAVNFTGTIFGKTGGVPVAKRSPQRQALRLQELERWRSRHGIALNLKPAFWPADETLGASMVLALREDGGDALGFAGNVLRAVWAEDRNIADETTLADIATAMGLDSAALIERARDPRWEKMREADTAMAMERGVFGAPSFLIEDQVYWGQDRLDFVEEHLR